MNTEKGNCIEVGLILSRGGGGGRYMGRMLGNQVRFKEDLIAGCSPCSTKLQPGNILQSLIIDLVVSPSYYYLPMFSVLLDIALLFFICTRELKRVMTSFKDLLALKWEWRRIIRSCCRGSCRLVVIGVCSQCSLEHQYPV